MHIPRRPPSKKYGGLFAAGLLTSSLLPVLGGEPDIKATSAKTVIEKAPGENPLCFFDDTLCFDVQERVRFEIRNNNFDFNDSVNDLTDDSWLLQRFRIGVLWKPAPWLKVYAQGQDAREFDSDRPNIPGFLGAEGDDNFDLRQAWVELGPTADLPVILKLGRQILSYGEERLVGGFEWNNFARTFDAAKLIYKHPKFQLDLFTSSVVVIRRDSFNTSDLFNGNETDRQQVFSGIYLSSNELPWGTAEVYSFLLNQKNGTTANLEAAVPITTPRGETNPLAQHTDFATFGARFRGDPKKLRGFEFQVEGAYQTGQVRDLSLSAWAITAGAGYNWLEAEWKPRLWVEYNYGSGDSDPTDDDIETFQNLFPTNHKFYGYMDLFSWQNIHNPMISFRVSPVKDVSVQLDYHAFWVASTDDVVYRANGLTPLRPLTPEARAADNYIGSEIDLTVGWTVNKNVQILAGYSHFFAGDYLSDTGPSDDADFGYLMATVSF